MAREHGKLNIESTHEVKPVWLVLRDRDEEVARVAWSSLQEIRLRLEMRYLSPYELVRYR